MVHLVVVVLKLKADDDVHRLSIIVEMEIATDHFKASGIYNVRLILGKKGDEK